MGRITYHRNCRNNMDRTEFEQELRANSDQQNRALFFLAHTNLEKLEKELLELLSVASTVASTMDSSSLEFQSRSDEMFDTARKIDIETDKWDNAMSAILKEFSIRMGLPI